MKVTVAIPIYNAARHLNVTLDSLINQTMPSNEFEVICVNDCSTDNSKEVIESYSKIMDNLILIDREVNSGGPMIPRNNAIEAARGEFIMFLDNDDFLGEEALERLYNSAKENKSDVIYGKYVGVNGRHVPQSMFKKGNRLNADIISDNLIYSLAPHKMFNLSFIRENGFEFHPKAVVGEDQLFVMQCYISAKVITVMADYDYYFVVARGNENLSLKYFPAEEFFFSFNRIMEFIRESNLNALYKKELKIAFLNRFLHASRLKGHLLSGLLTLEQKVEWLNETKLFFNTFVEDEIIPSLATRFQYLVKVAKDNDVSKLLSVHRDIQKITSNDITRVENGLIYANLKQLSKECSYDEEFVVNFKNTSNVFINDLFFGQKEFIIRGEFVQNLLINFDVHYDLILVHRNSGLEVSHKNESSISKGNFEFVVDYREILFDENLIGPWDLFVEASIGGYTKRRRIGASRAASVAAQKTNSNISSFGHNYSIRAYFTKPHDNISLDVKIHS
ncbi:glycosyltransferase [Bacillus sp. ISL-35]|uniref:glycosyltransferase n=1 Tax=Bacillus sp. ISL-35 TaxID=2819122 RepID=UPI001BE7C2CC|nr:glycosyltransferase [Bacillus sp. ISL-35]MBT2678834.1 glycosyltransferase [Bacillus sp. ISL-35]MBT2703826.1 glycosyltransferase [Chryseobacterium sp. ISL-80]